MLGLAGLIQACQLAAPGGPGTGDVTANAVAGDAIEVTSLDAPAADPEALPPAALATAAPQGAAPDSAADSAADAAADPVPAPIPDAGTTPADTKDAATATDPGAPAEAETEVLADPKSDQQLACERKRGRWVTAVGNSKACVFPTRDSGKRCERESQCEGLCLARSGTCSPEKPLYGCNDVFQDNGARVTLCLE
jgi:hypothetical protein